DHGCRIAYHDNIRGTAHPKWLTTIVDSDGTGAALGCPRQVDDPVAQALLGLPDNVEGLRVGDRYAVGKLQGRDPIAGAAAIRSQNRRFVIEVRGGRSEGVAASHGWPKEDAGSLL